MIAGRVDSDILKRDAIGLRVRKAFIVIRVEDIKEWHNFENWASN